MIRLFWGIYIPCATVALAWMTAQVAGPPAELALAPIRADQRIENVVRTASEVRWDWRSRKARPASAFNMDVFIETPRDRFITSVYERDTKEPWSRVHAVPVGQRLQSYCLQVPPSVRPGEPMTIKQTVFYPGWRGLWPLPVDLPDIIVPPAAAPT